MITDRARARSVRWTALFLAMGFAWAAPIRAAPIAYTMVVFVDPRETNFAPISGTLNGTAFGGAGKNVVMTFTFTGDTTDVIPFTSPVVGAENLLGSSSVQINSATSGRLLTRTKFLPSAGWCLPWRTSPSRSGAALPRISRKSVRDFEMCACMRPKISS